MGLRGLAVVGLALLVNTGCGILNFDADDDGLNNGEEVELGLDPENPDSDVDGMLDGAEIDAGLDPLVADTDADRLLDGAEALNGADPFVPDTDGDGYLDGDEVIEGHNPADDKDRIYQGRWPYYHAKDDLKNGPASFFEFDKRFKRLQMVDQHGDEVDLYDLYNEEGKYIVIDISAEWCGPCNAMASWIEGGVDTAGFGTAWPNGPEAVKNGDVYWITILGEDNYGNTGSQALNERWVDAYPSKDVIVLADTGYISADYAGLAWWPFVILLGPDLKVVDTGGDWGSAVDPQGEGVLPYLNDLGL